MKWRSGEKPRDIFFATSIPGMASHLVVLISCPEGLWSICPAARRPKECKGQLEEESRFHRERTQSQSQSKGICKGQWRSRSKSSTKEEKDPEGIWNLYQLVCSIIIYFPMVDIVPTYDWCADFPPLHRLEKERMPSEFMPCSKSEQFGNCSGARCSQNHFLIC